MEFDGFEIRTCFTGWLFRSVTVFKYVHANFSLESNKTSFENSEEIPIYYYYYYYYYYYLRIKRSLIITLSFNLQHKIVTTVRHAG